MLSLLLLSLAALAMTATLGVITVQGYVGKLFIVELNTGTHGSPTWVLISGMRSTSLDISNDELDVSNKDNMPWATGIEGGMQKMSLSMAGVFNDQAALDTMRAAFVAGNIKEFRVTTSDGAIWIGLFKLTKLSENGDYNGVQQYTMALASAGVPAYTAAP